MHNAGVGAPLGDGGGAGGAAPNSATPMQRHSAEPLNVRVGLNAGEPIEDEGDLFGSTVILASRIANAAAGGEILASDVVRGLCTGKPFVFIERGEQALKGFEEPVRVFEYAGKPKPSIHLT